MIQNTDEEFKVYQIAIMRYLRYKISQYENRSLQEQIKSLNQEKIMRYPNNVDDFIEYDLSTNKKVEIIGHSKGKNKREVVV